MPKGKQAEDQRTVTISIAKELVEEIDRVAHAEGRTRSNWIVYQLRKIMEARRQAKLVALPDAVRAVELSAESTEPRVADDPAAPPPRAGTRKRNPK